MVETKGALAVTIQLHLNMNMVLLLLVQNSAYDSIKGELEEALYIALEGGPKISL